MKKKCLTLTLTAVASLSLLAACGKKKTTKTTQGTNTREVTKTVTKIITKYKTITEVKDVDIVYEIYLRAKEAGYEGSYNDWANSIQGKEVELKVEGNKILWKYTIDQSWTTLCDLSTAKGTQGLSAYDLYKLNNPDYLGSEVDWINDLVLGKLQATSGEIRIKEDATEGLSYELSADKTYYIVNGIGDEVVATTIVVPEIYNNKPVKEVKNYAFSYRNDIEKVVLPSSIDKIDEGAFFGCTSLNSIEFSAATIGDDAFYNCNSLKKVYFNGKVDKWFDNIYGNEVSNPMNYADELYVIGSDNNYYNLNSNIVVDIPNIVTHINKYGFYNMTHVIGVVIPNSVTEIDEYAFKGNSALETISTPFLGKNKDSNETKNGVIGYLFGDEGYNKGVAITQTYNDDDDSETYFVPEGLKNVTITGDEIFYGSLYNMTMLDSIYSNATKIDSKALYNCAGVNKLILNNTQTIDAEAFSNMGSLKVFKMPTTVTNIEIADEGILSGCTSLEVLYDTYLSYYDDLEALQVVTVEELFGKNMFGSSYALDRDPDTFYIPNSLKELHLIDNRINTLNEGFLSGYTSLEKVYVETNSVAVSKEAFKGCTNLEYVEFKSIPTSIGLDAFKDCEDVEKIVIPKGYTKIITSTSTFDSETMDLTEYILDATEIITFVKQ